MKSEIARNGKIYIPVINAAHKCEYSANHLARAADDDKIDSFYHEGRLYVAEDDVESYEEPRAEYPYEENTEIPRAENGNRGKGRIHTTENTDRTHAPLPKAVAFVLALFMTGGVYVLGTTNAGMRVADGAYNSLTFMHETRHVVMREVRQKTANDGIDGLVIDSLQETGSMAVDSFENGTRMIAAIAASMDEISL